MRTFYCLFIPIVLVFPSAACQELILQTFSTRNGLPSSVITSLYQDSNGFLWIGTNNGLSVFDGYEFINYSTSTALSNSWITSIAESKREPGTMWIGTIAGGLNKLTNGNWTILDVDSTPQTVGFVDNLVDDFSGNLWCTSRLSVFIVNNSGLHRVQTRQWGDTPVGIVVTLDSLVWVASEKHLYRYHHHTRSPMEVPLTLSDETTITAIAASSDGSIWLGLSDSSVVCVKSTVVASRIQMRYGTPITLVSSNGLLWVRTEKHIVSMRESSPGIQELLPFTDRSGNSDTPKPILVDREDNLWIGTWLDGLHKLGDRSVTRFPIGPFDQQVSNTPAFVDDSGHAWVGAPGGLLEVYRTSEGKWTSTVHRLGYGESSVPRGLDRYRCILILSQDYDRISRYKVDSREGLPSRLQLINTFKQGIHYPNGTIVQLYVDAHEHIWIAVAPFGIVVLDAINGTLVQSIPATEAFPIRHVTLMYHDRDDRMWIGTFDAGLYILREGEMHPIMSFRKEDGLPGNEIRSLLCDNDGNMWIGTRYSGLALKTESGFKTLSTKEGLFNDAIWTMQGDKMGRLWLHTDGGVIAVDRKEMTPLPPKPELLIQGINGFGIHRDEFLWIKTPDGLTFMDFSRESSNRTPPILSLKTIEVGGIIQPAGEEVRLSYDQNTITLHFVGVSFRDEKGVRYGYRLLGLEDIWSGPTSDRRVTYAALNPGRYVFEVRATNADGVQSERSASIRIVIVPPFWRTWWFLLIAGLLLTGTIAGTARYFSVQRLQRRVQQLEKEQAVIEERNRTRERIASDLHDDVASSLSSIAFFVESLKRQVGGSSRGIRELLDKISSLSLDAEDAVGDIVWSIAPEHDTLQELVTRMRDFGSDLCLASDIEFELSATVPEEPYRLTDSCRKNVYLIFKEAIHNIIKHSHARKVQVSVRLAEHRLWLEVDDDGTGFEVSGTSRGHGLRNMSKRAETLGGGLTVVSVPGKGTSISLEATMA